MDKSHSPSLLNFAVTALVLIIALVYGIIAVSTQDAVWFVPTFDEFPQEIDLHCYGTLTTLLPEDEAFTGLVDVINRTLSSPKRFDQLTMSETTYAYYLTDPGVVMLEVHYSPRVRIHSLYKFFTDLDSIVLPLVGRHANVHAIFGRTNDLATGGSLRYAAITDVTAFVQDSGLCPAN